MKNMTEISVAELKQKIESGNGVKIIDVRTEEEFQNGSLPGAVNLPLDELRRDVSLIGSEINPGEEIICVCRGGTRSGEAARLLEKAGYGNVKNLKGGLLSWNCQNGS